MDFGVCAREDHTANNQVSVRDGDNGRRRRGIAVKTVLTADCSVEKSPGLVQNESPETIAAEQNT